MVLIFAPSLDFHGRVRVGRSMYLPAALHGVEASLLASDSLRKLCSSIHRVVWWRRQTLASFGAVLSLLDGPTGCDPAFCVVWFRFRLFRRYLAFWPSQVGRAYRLVEMVGEGCPGHGPIHLLSATAAEIGFWWDPDALAWSRPGLPLLSNLAGPLQHFKAAIVDAWRSKVAADLCGRKGFRGGPLLDVHGSLQLLNSSHVRERDEALLRSVMVGCLEWFFTVPCRFCGAPDGDGHLFLGVYLLVLLLSGVPPDGFDADEVAARMPDAPEVWSDGSLVLDSVTGVSAAGAGLFAHQSDNCWSSRLWGHVDRVQLDRVPHSCSGLVSVRGPLQTVQRAELWVVILALQSSDAIHGMLGACRMVAIVLPLLNLLMVTFLCLFVGCLIFVVVVWSVLLRLKVMLMRVWCWMVGFVILTGLVTMRLMRKLTLVGGGSGPAVIDARRNLSGVCGRWYPVILDLHRFIVAISRAVVNHDSNDGTAPDPMVLSAGALPKRKG